MSHVEHVEAGPSFDPQGLQGLNSDIRLGGKHLDPLILLKYFLNLRAHAAFLEPEF